jgi:hypothetical protein
MGRPGLFGLHAVWTRTDGTHVPCFCTVSRGETHASSLPIQTRVTPRHSHTTRTVRWLYSCFLWVVPLFVSPLSCNLLFKQFLRANVAFGRPNTRRADPNKKDSHLAGSGTGFLSYGASFPLILITTPAAAPSRNAKGSATILLPGRLHTHTQRRSLQTNTTEQGSHTNGYTVRRLPPVCQMQTPLVTLSVRRAPVFPVGQDYIRAVFKKPRSTAI